MVHRCFLKLIFWSVLFLNGETSPTCCRIAANSKWVEVGFFVAVGFVMYAGLLVFCLVGFSVGGDREGFVHLFCLVFIFFQISAILFHTTFPHHCFSHLCLSKCYSLSSATHTCPHNFWCSVEIGFLQNSLGYQCWIHVWLAIPSACVTNISLEWSLAVQGLCQTYFSHLHKVVCCLHWLQWVINQLFP